MRIIVTGANSGVGKATAAALAAAGHSVVIACRTIPKGTAQLPGRCGRNPGGGVHGLRLGRSYGFSVRTRNSV